RSLEVGSHAMNTEFGFVYDEYEHGLAFRNIVILLVRTLVYQVSDFAWTQEYSTSTAARPIGECEFWYDCETSRVDYSPDAQQLLKCELRHLERLSKIIVEPKGCREIPLGLRLIKR